MDEQMKKFIYYSISLSSNQYIRGSDVWHDQYAISLYKPPPGRRWKDDLEKIEPVIRKLPTTIEKRYNLTYISFGFDAGILDCSKDILFKKIGWDDVKKCLKIGRIFVKNGKEVEGWKTYLPRHKYYVDGLNVMEDDKENDHRIFEKYLNGGPIYTSAKYCLILREDIYDKIKHFKLKDCSVFKFDFNGPPPKEIGWEHSGTDEEKVDFESFLGELEIENHSSFGQVNDKRIKIFQIQNSIRLPYQYREYLRRFNGGFPKEDIVCPELHEDFHIHRFYGMGKDAEPHEQNLGYWIRIWKDMKVSDEMIPIADDGAGDYLCIGIRGDKTGKIFHWRHEAEEIVCVFDSLFQMLKSRSFSQNE